MELLILGFALLFAHFYLGVYHGWYYRGYSFGAVTHVLGGAFVFSISGSILITFLVAIIWEFFENWFDKTYPELSGVMCWYSRSLPLAICDIMFTSLGAILWNTLI